MFTVQETSNGFWQLLYKCTYVHTFVNFKQADTLAQLLNKA